MPALDYQLAFQDRGDYLRVDISGARDSFEISLAYWRAIAAECERRGTRSLLAVGRIGGPPLLPQEVDELVQVMRDSYMTRMRVAYCEATDTDLSGVEYGELSARESGYTVRVFGSEREAELWLRYGET